MVQAMCESLEYEILSLRQQLKEKDVHIALLQDELDLYKSEVNGRKDLPKYVKL